MSIENLSVEEIKKLIEENKKKVIDYSQDTEIIEKEINKCKQVQKEIIAKIPSIQEICRKRTETLEKIRRYQRKLLSIYSRFPGIIQSDAKHVISTDEITLKRQLENVKKRKTDSQQIIETIKSELEQLKQKKIELINDDNIQSEVLEQREQIKVALSRNLKKELDSAKFLYIAESRMIEQRLSAAKHIIGDNSSKLAILTKQFEDGLQKRKTILPTLKSENQKKAQELAQLQMDVIIKTKKFLNWWGSRRMLNHLQERNSFLKDCLRSTEERVNDSFKSIENMTKSNKDSEKELRQIQQININLVQKVKLAEERAVRLNEKLEEIQKSFVPLPKEITDKQQHDREERDRLINERKSLDIDLQILSDTSPEFQKALSRLDKARKELWNATRRRAESQSSIESLKRQLEDHHEPKNVNISPGALSDPRVLLGEDSSKNTKYVSAGPLEILTRIIFEPTNEDPIYPHAYLVMIHTIKQELPLIIKLIVTAYDSGDYNDTRQQRLTQLLDVWNMWFKNSFPQAQQLVTLCGWSKGTDFSINENCEYENVLDIDMGTDIAFVTTPLILAQHFAYHELQLLYSLPGSELIGTSWTKLDKWTLAPNVMKFTEHFNTVTCYIMSTILNTNTPEERAQYIERWIQIMSEAAEIYNYLLVFEIYGALCNPAIFRLKLTWEHVSQDSKDIYEKMQTFTSPMRQFQKYKEKLDSCPVTIVVPYIGPMLTNLVYTHDGNQSTKKLPGSGEEVINFNKYRIYASIMKEIMQPWGKDVKFLINKKILLKIKQIPPPDLSDTEAYKLSIKIEPEQVQKKNNGE